MKDFDMSQSENQMRQNILTGKWVIYAPQRQKRPNLQQTSEKQKTEPISEKDENCPFCPGNEKMLPGIINEMNSVHKDIWLTRTVPNKYPALNTDEDIKGGNKGPFLTASAYGKHEVVIETPVHSHDIPLMTLEQVGHVIETYQQRSRYLQDNFDQILNVTIFRNHGSNSGTSLFHPHSQIIASAIIPQYIHEREAIADKYYETAGNCSLCDITEYEKTENKRVISENASFIAIVPFAAEVPFEVWLIPKIHRSDFTRINDEQIAGLSEILRIVLIAYYNRLDDPDYNYVIHSCSRQKEKQSSLHWFLQIRPRLTTPAGFEIGSGVHINPSLPEQDAKTLKQQIDEKL